MGYPKAQPQDQPYQPDRAGPAAQDSVQSNRAEARGSEPPNTLTALFCKARNPKGDGALNGIGDHDDVGDVDDEPGKGQTTRDVDLDGRSTEERVAPTLASKEDLGFVASQIPFVGDMVHTVVVRSCSISGLVLQRREVYHHILASSASSSLKLCTSGDSSATWAIIALSSCALASDAVKSNDERHATKPPNLARLIGPAGRVRTHDVYGKFCFMSEINAWYCILKPCVFSKSFQ